MKGIYILCFLCSLLLISCSDYTPKPLGYPRIERAEGAVQKYENEKISFLYPRSAEITQLKTDDNKEVWFNISYPKYDATIYCTYVPITKETLRKALDDSYHLAYSHASKAEGINQSQFVNAENRTSGIIYDIKGSVAVPLQFFVTDSIYNFMRGSVYYNHVINPDSVAPITQFLRDDIVLLIESLEWKNPK